MFRGIQQLLDRYDNLCIDDWECQVRIRDQAIVELFDVAQRLNLTIAQTHDPGHYAKTCKHPVIEKYAKIVEEIKSRNE